MTRPVRALQSTGKSKTFFTWHYALVKNSFTFVNIIFIANIFTDKSYEKNIVGYYSYQNSLNFNFERDGVLYIDNGREYVETSYKKIYKDLYSFDFDGQEVLFIVAKKDYVLYFSKDDKTINIEKISNKNITNTQLEKVESLGDL